ncbi:MAG: xanthine dehydrogenase family protein subunit M [Haliangiales bacterium]
MRYEEPETVEEGVSLLGSSDNARCLAGGATLVALMNAERVRPELVVSLQRIPELVETSTAADDLWIGAMTRVRDLSADSRLVGARRVVRSAARKLAHPSIRNMATIGGSVGLANPETELPGALVAAAARVEIAGPSGRRVIPVEDVFVDRYQSSLAPDELITRIAIPAGVDGALGHHLRFSRVAGDYPTVSISLVLALDGDTCTYARVVVGSCAPVPLHVAAADQRLEGSDLDHADIAAAGAMLASAAAPVDDVRGSAAYRRTLIPRLLGRAVAQVRRALSGAEDEGALDV